LDWKLTLAGLLIGLLVGMTGMGGGSLMTPMLILIFGFKPTVAVGTDIVHGAVFKSVGSFKHWRLGNVRPRLAGWLFLGSAGSSLLGVWLADWIEHRFGDGVGSLSAKVLGATLLIGCAGLIVKTVLHPGEQVSDFVLSRRDKIWAVSIGLVGGFVVGLTSVGTGVFFGLAMLVLYPLAAQKVVGTDLFHAAALLYVAGAGHLAAGNVDLGTVGWLLTGSIPGVLIGSQLTVSIPERPLRLVLALVLGISGLKLLDPPGANIVVVTLAAAGGAALLAWAWVQLRRWRRSTTRPPQPA
jgi:uncharacterized membrane protein YfcA